MRVISLSDGRVCYLKAARRDTPLPPGRALALATVAGTPRFSVELPEGWAGAQESELRQHVEARLAAKRAAGAKTTNAAPQADLPKKAPSAGGLLSRWFGK